MHQLAQAVEESREVGKFPRSLVELICEFVQEIHDIQALTCVNRRWRDIASADALWEPVLRRRRRAELLMPQATYGMLPPINIKRAFKEWYLQWAKELCDEKGLKRQEENYKKEVASSGFLHHTAQVTTMVPYVQGDKRLMFTGDERGHIQLRDPNANPVGVVVATLSEHEGRVNFIEVTENYVITGADDCMCHAWGHDSLSFPKFTMGAHTEGVTAVGSMPGDDSQIVTGSLDRTVIVWNLTKSLIPPAKTGGGNYTHAKQIATLKGHTMKVTQIKCTEKLIFTASTDSHIRVWDWRGKSVTECVGHKGPIYVMSLAVLPVDRSGKQEECLVSTCGGGMLRCWTTNPAPSRAGKIIWMRSIHSTPINCLAIEGALVVTGSNDGSVNIYDVVAETSIGTLNGHESVVRTVIFDLPKKRVIAGSDDRTCCVWDVTSALENTSQRTHVSPLYQLKGPKAAVVEMRLIRSQSGKWEKVVVASNDKMLHFWKMK